MTKAHISFAAGICLLIAMAMSRYVYMHSGKPDLHTSLSVEKADYGIPGVTKVYDATLTNIGTGPIRVTRCDFVDDTATPGEELAYAIQRWSSSSQQWKEILGSSRDRFCHPYPLGMAQTHLKRAWLWPGQGLSIGEEATAARDGIDLGDKLRFVLFTGEPGDYASSIPTEAFVIDEASTSDVPLRIRH